MFTKDELYDSFHKFVALVQNKAKIKNLQSDHSSKYDSANMKKILDDNGIKHVPVPAYTPEWNGIVERYNQTVMNMVRAMLADANLPTKFWAEALITAVHINNHLPTSANPHNASPYELWTGAAPQLSNIRTFGCIGVC